MFEKERQRFQSRSNEIGKALLDPAQVSNPTNISALSQEHKELTELISLIDSLNALIKQVEETRAILSTETDAELKSLAEEELLVLEEELSKKEALVKERLMPSDPNDKEDLVLEIRAGAGGDEAELFAAELFRMYSRFVERNNLSIEIDSLNSTPLGGIKEVIAEIKGHNAYKYLKYESGVHRVQRVPETEKQGRIHTSTATVAVLPLPKEAKIEIRPEDLRIDVYRSSGHGGQSVNTTDSAVRITHLPTGVVVTCQDEKSQLKNREKALRILKARLLAAKEERLNAERGQARRLQVGTGDRSEKIRTYNFPQDRISDHRIGVNIHNVPLVMEGNLEPLFSELQKADMEDRAKAEEQKSEGARSA